MSRLAQAWARGACAGGAGYDRRGFRGRSQIRFAASIQELLMLELHFPPPHRADEHMVSVRRIIAEILDVQRLRGNRAANQAVIDKIGLDVMQERDEDYCREAIDYHLGILYAYIRDP